MVSFLGNQSKMYAYLLIGLLHDANHLIVYKKAKGIPGRVAKLEVNWKTYEDAAYFDHTKPVTFNMMMSRHHVIEHRSITKIGVTSNNDRIFMLGPDEYRLLGHYRNYLPEAALENGDEL